MKNKLIFLIVVVLMLFSLVYIIKKGCNQREKIRLEEKVHADRELFIQDSIQNILNNKNFQEEEKKGLSKTKVLLPPPPPPTVNNANVQEHSTIVTKNNSESVQEKVVCNECSGVGTIKIQTRCDDCRGRGKVTCRQCSGTGKWGDIYPTKGIYEPPTCSLCSGTGITKCNNCQGKGEITIIKTCPKCNGAGRY